MSSHSLDENELTAVMLTNRMVVVVDVADVVVAAAAAVADVAVVVVVLIKKLVMNKLGLAS